MTSATLAGLSDVETYASRESQPVPQPKRVHEDVIIALNQPVIARYVDRQTIEILAARPVPEADGPVAKIAWGPTKTPQTDIPTQLSRLLGERQNGPRAVSRVNRRKRRLWCRKGRRSHAP